MTYSQSLEGDSADRAQAALLVAGTTDPIEAHIKDYGDFEGDYSEAELEAANGYGTTKYWDDCNSADNEITPLK